MSRTKRMTHAERRAQLIEVGRSVFAKNGYDATTMEEIARSAKVSKPIVYEHFRGKEGLYAVIVDREMESLYQRIVRVVSEGTARERYEQAVLAFLTYVESQPDGFAVLTQDAPMSMTGRGMRSVISNLGERVGGVFEEQLRQAGLDTKAAPIYAHALIGMVIHSGEWWWSERRGFKKEEVASHVAALGWMGLRHIPREPLAIR